MTEESKDTPTKKKNGKPRFWCNCGFHTWSKWNDERINNFGYWIQTRTCVGCGRTEMRNLDE